MKHDFLSILDLSREELEGLFILADALRNDTSYRPLQGKTAALIFQKPSLRTRVSFEVGITQLGGHPTFLSHEAIGLGTREKTSDVARLLSRYVELIVARVFDHEILTDLGAHASIPVINALSDFSHPCQVMADIYTIRQHKRLKEGLKVAYVGDGNNVVNSWIELATIYPLTLTLGCPKGYGPSQALLENAQKAGVSRITLTPDPIEAVRGAEVVFTDTWTSMGKESEAEQRKQIFTAYQLNETLLGHASSGALVMHCLPAHRGEEITDAVLDGPQSVVFDEAENRLHIQKAILVNLTGNAALARSMGLRQQTVDV